MSSLDHAYQENIEALLTKIGPLRSGGHVKNDEGAACIMEAVAFVAGEAWSDHPACTCPVISTFLRSWNDALPDNERDALLRPLIPQLVGTKSTEATETRRALMCADWLVRVHAPMWLRLAKLDKQADLLASLPEITDMAQVPSLRHAIEAVRDDADAARAAASDAARVAARVAAWAAASAAARAAASDAAWVAARAAASDAARAAASDALAVTRRELQQSALDLVRRMIAAKEPS
jgi:hypothetical protein